MSIIDIIVPNVAESVTEATIGKWLKKNGEFVQQDEIIVELETDKATQEFPAEHSGILNIIAEEGTLVQVGETIAKIDTSASNNAEPKIVDKPAVQLNEPKSTGKVLQMNVPAVGESITEVTIANWLKQDGEMVNIDDVLCEIESDKATFELTSEAQGKLKIMALAGETLPIGAPICQIEVFEGNIESTDSHTNEVTPVDAKPNQENYATGHPSPAASKILAEKGINPNDVNGTGIEGRITKEDAINAVKNPEVKPLNKNSNPDAVNLNNSIRTEERKKMTSLRKTISKRLVAVKNETAMLTTFNEVDMKPIMDIRKKYKDSFKDKFGIGLGFMSFFTKAVCEALQAWPAVGAQIDGDEIIYPNYCDVSIAVSTPKGLVVPVIRNAEKLSFDQIEKEIMALAIKARDGKLSIEEMTGGTFTITNGGIFGSMLSTPIINAPQAAILGMHNIVERPVAINGQVEIRPIMYVALSYDHRIIDGKESVNFLKMVKELLEDPTRMLLGI